jgi:hypothetical protein
VKRLATCMRTRLEAEILIPGWGEPITDGVVVMSGAMIEYATAIGPSTPGRLAPLSGQLQAGYDADVICLDVNPLNDLSVFADVAHVVGVWRGGRHVKG